MRQVFYQAQEGTYTILATNTWFNVNTLALSTKSELQRVVLVSIPCLSVAHSAMAQSLKAGDNLSDTGSTNSAQVPFTGFGFPRLDSVDFSEGVELPLTLSQPQVAPVAGDLVALYTYDATAGQVAYPLTLAGKRGYFHRACRHP